MSSPPLTGGCSSSIPRTRLVFVGDGPYLKELREALPEAVFTGYLSGGDLAKAFASADIFVFPSTTDTFGNVVLEAMASGLPAVVSDTGGPRELVKNGVTGYVTRSLDVEDFTTAAGRLVADPALRASDERAGARGRAGPRLVRGVREILGSIGMSGLMIDDLRVMIGEFSHRPFSSRYPMGRRRPSSQSASSRLQPRSPHDPARNDRADCGGQ